MPIIESKYTPPFIFRNGHVSTIYPNLFRIVKGVNQQRERLELDDGDFIDLDWSYSPDQKSKKLAVLIHGLEGNGQRQYILGLAKHLNNNNWDAVAINLRNCSGEVNRLYKSYNAGASEDLNAVINHIISNYKYPSISICGFSLGGNLLLKYIGEKRQIPSEIKSCVAISVPCDLHNSLLELNKSKNYIYQQRFINNLKNKLYERWANFPDKIQKKEINACKSLLDIDNLYTSKAHGYKDAIDYYTKCSSKQFLHRINIPTLIINAKNDSFLGSNCYPIEEAKNNKNLFLEVPYHGGHVGFYLSQSAYYNENRALEFFETLK
ncbi:YheT family hydrolase [Aquimarina sp. 2201CG5-10]|uniref:YheT family hydrolase n=1 Tax=Aquimarina callyspongiae TaxID=3098150 RepID=UPI002AB4FAB6|nr:alpha/beta fold hydrolase [Aquimarina sp. 2201CG5-10]MDY8137118.1 alpha/beta fold hydrolase [Aquimarina sp. 2201CG5-10]